MSRLFRRASLKTCLITSTGHVVAVDLFMAVQTHYRILRRAPAPMVVAPATRRGRAVYVALTPAGSVDPGARRKFAWVAGGAADGSTGILCALAGRRAFLSALVPLRGGAPPEAMISEQVAMLE